jgi:hypothetical protein
MSIVPCMGGWCGQRDKCAHYVSVVAFNLVPAERLCAPGKDEPEPIKPAREEVAA